MFAISAKYSFPIHENLSDKELLKYLESISDDEIIKVFEVYADSYEENADQIEVISGFTSLISFIENEQEDSKVYFNGNLKNLIDLNLSGLQEGLNFKVSKILKSLVDLNIAIQMTPEPEYIFDHLIKKGFSIPTNVLHLAELIEFLQFATKNFRRVSRIPDKFSGLNIPDAFQYYLRLTQNQILLYQIHIDVLRNIILHFIENPNSGLPSYYYEMESKAVEPNRNNTTIGRNRNEIFTKEKVKIYVDEFISDYKYPKPHKFWHIGGVQDGAIVKSELAKYILFEKFKATEDEFSLKSMESRIEEVIPKKYLPSHKKNENRKRKK